MGRHSAPDDQPDGGDIAVAESTAPLDLTAPVGRHEAPDDADILPDGNEKKAVRGESGTQADLRLLRQRPAVRAQCLAAVVVSFGLYTLVMFVIGRSDRYLLWLWTPIVVCGVLIGAVLDLAHRRERTVQPSEPVGELAEPAEPSA